MSDIVQKLRAYRPRYGWPEEYSTIVEPTMNHVAADEIERLRAEVEEQARLNGMGAERELALQAEIERLRKALAKIAQHDMQAVAMDALRPGERIREEKK